MYEKGMSTIGWLMAILGAFKVLSGLMNYPLVLDLTGIIFVIVGLSLGLMGRSIASDKMPMDN